MNIQAKFDFTKFFADIDRIVKYVENESVQVSGEVVIADIKRNNEAGESADKKKFDNWREYYSKVPKGYVGNYSPSQEYKRKKAGKGVTTKNLEVTGRLKKAIYTDIPNKRVTVQAAFLKIAEGLQSHPGWKYWYKFLFASEAAQREIETVNAKKIIEL